MTEQDMIEIRRYLDADQRNKEFWASVRSALIMFIKAIEKRYNITQYDFKDVRQVPIGETDSVTGMTKGQNG